MVQKTFDRGAGRIGCHFDLIQSLKRKLAAPSARSSDATR
jgi:hypothetical protein